MNVFAPYSFHMPLFFFISGLFFSDSKVDGVLSTIVKNTKSLLLYSTAFYIFYAGVCWVITRLGFTAFSQPFSLELIFLNQFTTSGAYRFTAAYWFIPCLFFVKLYFSLIHVRLISLIKSRREGLVSLSFLAAYMAIAFAAVVYSVEMYEQKGVQLDKIIYYRFAFALFFFYLGSIVSKYKVQRIFSNIFVLAVLYIVQQQLWASAGNLDFWMQVSKYQATYLPVISSGDSIFLRFI
jgi:fucose 4-O-acetylase-like acetyltransferase